MKKIAKIELEKSLDINNNDLLNRFDLAEDISKAYMEDLEKKRIARNKRKAANRKPRKANIK